MGTDIYILTERKHAGKWINCDDWRLNPYFGDSEIEPRYVLNPVYQKINYNLFAVLGNVRYNNGRVPCICEPRGLPDDVSKETDEYIDHLIGIYGHSYSYLTVKELWKYWKETDPKIQEEHDLLMTKKEVILFDKTGFYENNIIEQFIRTNDRPESYVRKRVIETSYPMDSFMDAILKRFVDVMYLTPIDEKATVKEIRLNKTLESEVNSFGNKFRVVFCFDN